MPGRYLYPAAAGVFVLVAAGIDALPRLLIRGVAAAGAGGALFALALLVNTQFGLAIHHEALPRANAGVAAQAHAASAGFDVVADRVLVSDGGKTISVHVTVSNQSQHPADFPATPEATVSGVLLFGDYADSTAFRERLGPGESESGWLVFKRASAKPLKKIVLIYTPVSTDGFATIQTLSLVVAP